MRASYDVDLVCRRVFDDVPANVRRLVVPFSGDEDVAVDRADRDAVESSCCCMPASPKPRLRRPKSEAGRFP